MFFDKRIKNFSSNQPWLSTYQKYMYYFFHFSSASENLIAKSVGNPQDKKSAWIRSFSTLETEIMQMFNQTPGGR